MIYVGIDNGTSGSIGILVPKKPAIFIHTPIKKELNYTKIKRYIHRIDKEKLKNLLSPFSICECKVGIERPMINPMRFQASVSAARALEATLIVLEELKLSFEYLDSKGWQKALLPKNLKGNELKTASLDIAKRIFPKVNYKGFKDADGLLIAHYLITKDNKND